MSILTRMMGMRMYIVISLFNEKGEILEVFEDPKGVVMKLVSEVKIGSNEVVDWNSSS